MDIQFRKGTAEYLDSCVKAMENSTLCTSYFQSEESRKNAVMEGINRGTYMLFYAAANAPVLHMLSRKVPFMHTITCTSLLLKRNTGEKG
jgi:hypothetical protein